MRESARLTPRATRPSTTCTGRWRRLTRTHACVVIGAGRELRLARELAGLGCPTLLITASKDVEDAEHLTVLRLPEPPSPLAGAVLEILPLQLLAAELVLRRGLRADGFRYAAGRHQAGRPMTQALHIVGNVQLDVLASPVDRLPRPGGDDVIDHIAVRPAGAAGNVSLTLAALGVEHRLFGAVGDDLALTGASTVEEAIEGLAQRCGGWVVVKLAGTRRRRTRPRRREPSAERAVGDSQGHDGCRRQPGGRPAGRARPRGTHERRPGHGDTRRVYGGGPRLPEPLPLVGRTGPHGAR